MWGPRRTFPASGKLDHTEWDLSEPTGIMEGQINKDEYKACLRRSDAGLSAYVAPLSVQSEDDELVREDDASKNVYIFLIIDVSSLPLLIMLGKPLDSPSMA